MVTLKSPSEVNYDETAILNSERYMEYSYMKVESNKKGKCVRDVN